MTDEKIARINELYKKSKAEGLTEEEKKEQDLLRKEFVANVRMNLKAQLNSIDLVDADGNVENLGEKYGDKRDKRPGKRRYFFKKCFHKTPFSSYFLRCGYTIKTHRKPRKK